MDTPLMAVNVVAQLQSTGSGVPVTVLSGFLGTGKTSMLSNILSNTDGLKIGVIVNDMGSINIDTEIAVSKQKDGVVSLQNGCVCCALRSNLIDELKHMVLKSELDAIVVECSGIAEPRRIASSIQEVEDEDHVQPKSTAGDDEVSQRTASYVDAQRDATASASTSTVDDISSSRKPRDGGGPPSIYLDTLVTLVDCESFLYHFNEGSETSVKECNAFVTGEQASKQDSRNILDLLVEQIEVADVIVLNKTDLVSTEQLQQLSAIITSLNPYANIRTAMFGRVPLTTVVSTGLNRQNRSNHEFGASTEHGNTYEGTMSGLAGIQSFTFNTRRPFHPIRLHELVVSWIPTGCIRSKGFVCVADAKSNNVSDIVGHSQLYWAHAGRHLRLHEGRPCGAHTPEAWTSVTSASPNAGACRFHDHCDDVSIPNCSSVVFIGISPNREDIERRLRACLITDDEINTGVLQPDTVNPIKALPAAAWIASETFELETKQKWTRIAVVLATFTIVWNLVEGVVSVQFGVEEESLSVISFGVDSMIEVISACFVLWRLWKIKPGETVQPHQIWRERVATFAIAILLIALALSAIAGAIWTLAERETPKATTAGIVIASISLSFMFGLWWAKMNAAIILDSRTLEADANCSFGCITLSIVLLLGSVLFEATPMLWFADATAAIIIALVIGWDGVGELRASLRSDFDGCGCSHKPGHAAKFLRKRLLTSGGNLKSAAGKASLPTLDPSFTQTGALRYCNVHNITEAEPCVAVDISTSVRVGGDGADDDGGKRTECDSECCVKTVVNPALEPPLDDGGGG
eukprot:m.223614 g.223614  ORF g.223614 m.223614 type:complete len:807 (+) comp33408_c0_seq3:165-2585(+)